MRCISLWQPWASAIPLGLKQIETRGWSTAVRGRIGIHAAKRWTKAERDFTAARRRAGDPFPDPLPLGAIVATAVLHQVLTSEQLLPEVSQLELMYGDYGRGRFGWLLEDVVSLDEPIEWLGKQGFFNVPDELFPAAALAAPRKRGLGVWPFPVSAHEDHPDLLKGGA